MRQVSHTHRVFFISGLFNYGEKVFDKDMHVYTEEEKIDTKKLLDERIDELSLDVIEKNIKKCFSEESEYGKKWFDYFLNKAIMERELNLKDECNEFLFQEVFEIKLSELLVSGLLPKEGIILMSTCRTFVSPDLMDIKKKEYPTYNRDREIEINDPLAAITCKKTPCSGVVRESYTIDAQLFCKYKGCGKCNFETENCTTCQDEGAIIIPSNSTLNFIKSQKNIDISINKILQNLQNFPMDRTSYIQEVENLVKYKNLKIESTNCNYCFTSEEINKMSRGGVEIDDIKFVTPPVGSFQCVIPKDIVKITIIMKKIHRAPRNARLIMERDTMADDIFKPFTDSLDYYVRLPNDYISLYNLIEKFGYVLNYLICPFVYTSHFSNYFYKIIFPIVKNFRNHNAIFVEKRTKGETSCIFFSFIIKNIYTKGFPPHDKNEDLAKFFTKIAAEWDTLKHKYGKTIEEEIEEIALIEAMMKMKI